MEISSSQNKKIKQLTKLQQKSRERKKLQLFVVEGVQENRLAISNGFEAVQFFVCHEIFDAVIPLPKVDTFSVSKEMYEKIAYRSTTGGILGVYKTKVFELKDLKTLENPLLVVLEAVEKPGNLGAILRSCDAAKVDAVIVCDPKADFFNPNVIRSSVGTVFTQKIITTETSEFLNFCTENQIQTLATYLRDDTWNLYDVDLTQPSALIFGTEAVGLSDIWSQKATKTVKIPMLGQVDSLNVSNAVAVCVFEAVRQRI